MQPEAPPCPKCNTGLRVENSAPGVFRACAQCGAQVSFEVFPSFGQGPVKGQSGEHVLIEEESRCFFHEDRKASVLCELCGRFLCRLCDCEVRGRHFCPRCLETGGKTQRIPELEHSRTLYGRMALACSIVPLFITGLAAIFLFWRHRQDPGSLVTHRAWMMPLALVLGVLQTLVFGIWFLMLWIG